MRTGLSGKAFVAGDGTSRGVVATQEAVLRVNLTITPEMWKSIGGEQGLRWSVRLDPVQPVDTPPVYQPVRSTTRTGERSIRRTAGPIREHFLELMRRGALLQQSDYRLGARGLLIPDGGLCATTSAVNVLHAAFSHVGADTSTFTSTSDDLVARLVGRAWQDLGRDARMGLDFSSLEQVVNHVANQIDPNVGVHSRRGYFRPKSGDDLAKLLADADTLPLLCVTTGERSAHAITLLGVDQRRGVVSYSDPNHPNQYMERSYWSDRDHLRIEGFGGYGAVTDVLEIRTRAFDRKGVDRWKPLEKKRVWITDAEGRRHLTTIDRIDLPSPEWPSGRVVQYSYLFGGGGGGTWPIEDIASIDAVKAPAEQEVRALSKHVGKSVRIRFTDAGFDRQYGDQIFTVKAVSREAGAQHPHGGLDVKAAGDAYGRSGIVPFEAIASVEVVSSETPKKKRKVV
jgi:hypothetical protein